MVLDGFSHSAGLAYVSVCSNLLPAGHPLHVLAFRVLLNAYLFGFFGDVSHTGAPPGVLHRWAHLGVAFCFCVHHCVFLFCFYQSVFCQDLSHVWI